MSSENLDLLTGLLTAQSFFKQLDLATQENEKFILVNMDLDHFMEFNAKYGHTGGDEWLKAISHIFAETFSSEKTFTGRYGGDEFMAVVRGEDMFAVYDKAEKLRQMIEKNPIQILVNNQPIAPAQTISIGLVAFPENGSSPNDLIEKVRTTLYRSKNAGGNQVSFYQEKDPLTDLHNAEATEMILEEKIAAARAKNEPLSILSLDIDNFKQLNDEYGHHTGDEILKRLAHILSTNFNEVGACGRVGGDAFLVILPGQRSDSVFVLAEEVRRLIDDNEIKLTIGSKDSSRSLALKFHISGGVANYPSDASDRVDLLRKADEALYRSKQTGRNRISLPTSAQMITKTSYYTQIQLERLSTLARQLDKTEAFLLREALDDLFRKYAELEIK